MAGFSLTALLNVAEELNGVDWDKLLTMLRSGDLQQELVVGETAADFLAQFFPEAKYVEDAMKLFGFIMALKQAGVWTDAQPEDPAMERAAGHTRGQSIQGHS